jgi:hypothetical protein
MLGFQLGELAARTVARDIWEKWEGAAAEVFGPPEKAIKESVKTRLDSLLDFEVMSPDDPRAFEALAKSNPIAVHYKPAGKSAEKRCNRCAMFKPGPKRDDLLRGVDGCTSVRA